MLEPTLEADDYNADTHEPVGLMVSEEFAGQRIDQVLAQLLPEFSRSRLQEWIRQGHVQVDNLNVSPKHKLSGGEQLWVNIQTEAQNLAFSPEDLPLDILYEDDSLLVINKPAGLVVHPGSGNWSGTLLNALLFHRPALGQLPRAGIVHRLDKDTSGLMVVAKTNAAQLSLIRQLQDKSVYREYAAVAQGLIKEDGKVDAPIGRHPVDRTRMAVHPMGKPAVTHYEVQGWFRAHTLLHCRLETGRTHQIRVHLASIGHALFADPVYGGRAKVSSPILKTAEQTFARQALHAQTLGLKHPEDGREQQWQVPRPADFDALIATLTADFYEYADPALIAQARQ